MDELLKLAVNGGVGVVLAVVVLKWQREDGKARAEECKRCADDTRVWATQERDDKIMLMQVLQQNTQVITELREAVQALVAHERSVRT